MIKYSKKNSRIETERLILRYPHKKDISDVVRNLNDLKVSQWLLVVPYPYTRKDGLWYVNHCEEKLKEKPQKDYGYWMELKETGEIIGGIGLHKVDHARRKGEVGYWLGVRHHRKGYGSEALEVLLDLAFRKLKLERLEAGVFEGNPSSGKLLEKYGFHLRPGRRKILRSKASGKCHKELPYFLLREEYKPRRRIK